jgi:amino acid transporter
MRAVETSPAAGDAASHELKPNAVSLLQSTVIGIATSAPGQSTAVTLAAMVAVTAYATVPAIIICTVPMLFIALSYRRLNMWDQNCGGSYVWVGKSISPYLGFMIGWAMLVGYVLGGVSDILPLGPNLLSLFGIDSTSVLGNVLTATIFGVGVTAIAAIGIQVTARFQLTIAVVEYVILLVFSLIAFYAVFIAHAAGTVHPTWEWLNPNGVGGTGSLAAGMLVAVYLFTGWDASIYINEETKKKESNPGKAVIIAVCVLGPVFALLMVSFQGVVSANDLNNNAASALPFIASRLVSPPWDKLMAIAVILSVIGTTQACVVSSARISYSMGADRLIPGKFGTTNPKYRTPFFSALVWGGVTVVVSDLYVLSSSLATAFSSVVSTVGLLFTVFYVFTAVATTWYYRKLAMRSLTDFVMVGVLPIVGAAVLGWVFEQSITSFQGLALWAIIGIAVVGLVVMCVSAFVTRSPFFRLPRETYEPQSTRT